MQPSDFHKTAEFLKDREEEWHIRTSINRSYYGLFLYFRDFLKGQGVRLPDRKVKSHHQFVLECFHKSRFFRSSKDSAIFGIYSRLRTLLQRRTDADYKLRLLFRVNDSKDSFRLAITTIEDFKKLRNSEREKHIINVAKNHAKQVISS